VFQKFSFLRSLFACEFAFYAAWAEKVSPDFFFVSELSFNDLSFHGVNIDHFFAYCHQMRHSMWSASLQTLYVVTSDPGLVLNLVLDFLSITYKTVKSFTCPDEYEGLALTPWHQN